MIMKIEIKWCNSWKEGHYDEHKKRGRKLWMKYVKGLNLNYLILK